MRLLPERAEYEFFIFDPYAELESSIVSEPLTVYPNPTTSIINVRGTKAQRLSCSLYNMLGQLILKQDFYGAAASLQVDGLDSGAYLLMVNEQSFKVLKK
jgi:hypothetical protein